MEWNQKKAKLSPQTDFEKLWLNFFKKGISHYKALMKEGLLRFDKSGELEITNADGTSYKQFGDS